MDKEIYSFEILLTTDCPFKCGYCAVINENNTNERNYQMSSLIHHQGELINYHDLNLNFIKNFSKYHDTRVVLMGGEIMLYPKLVQDYYDIDTLKHINLITTGVISIEELKEYYNNPKTDKICVSCPGDNEAENNIKKGNFDFTKRFWINGLDKNKFLISLVLTEDRLISGEWRQNIDYVAHSYPGHMIVIGFDYNKNLAKYPKEAINDLCVYCKELTDKYGYDITFQFHDSNLKNYTLIGEKISLLASHGVYININEISDYKNINKILDSLNLLSSDLVECDFYKDCSGCGGPHYCKQTTSKTNAKNCRFNYSLYQYCNSLVKGDII